MLKKVFFCVLILSYGHTVLAQTGTLTGTIKSAKTGATVIGASVQLEGTTLVGKTNINGVYTIENIPTKTYNIICSSIGFEKETRFGVVVRSEGNADLDFELSTKKKKLGKVVIRQNPFKKLEETPLSIQKLSKEEIVAYPGGNNDCLLYTSPSPRDKRQSRMPSSA